MNIGFLKTTCNVTLSKNLLRLPFKPLQIMGKIIVILSLWIIICQDSFSQDGFDFMSNKKSLAIFKTSESITIDGDLSEGIWIKTEKHGAFYQQSPLDGILSETVREVQVTYDDANLYIAATLYDDDDYVIRTLKRDNFGQGDEFAVVIDPQNQKSNGFAFGVNAAGAPTEVLISPDDAD